jgi:metallo-beta-lactamase family protein
MESTYGDRLHSTEDPSTVLTEEINKVEQTGGALLIPAFALERTQELLHKIMHLKKTGKIRAQTPVFMDSPMAQSATEIYLDYPKLFNLHVAEDLKLGNPFEFPGLEVIGKRNESQGIHYKRGPKVIIAGSGMMTGGRIVGHAAHYLENPTTRLLIVGYQGEETLGRELMEGKREVIIDGVEILVKAAVNTTLGMSSHADQGQLMEWIGHIKNVQKVILTHGEDGPRTALSEKISNEIGIRDIKMPHLNEEISF